MGDGLYDLAALDMDFTLLNSNHEITPFTRRALRRADEAGKVIALCTGRCLSELRPYLDAVPAIRYAINESGGSLYDVRRDRVLRQCSIDRALGERLLALAECRDVLVQCFFGGQAYVQPDAVDRLDHWNMAHHRDVFEMGSAFVGDVRELWRKSGQPLEKINLHFSTVEEKRRFLDEAGEIDAFVADSLGIGCEISPPDATKPAGLDALCRHLGVPVERVMAVGDGANDVELMRVAGFSVAMGNAVEEVRRCADALTDDCDHDGAGKAVLKYMLGEEG